MRTSSLQADTEVRPAGWAVIRWRLVGAAVLATFLLAFVGVALIISGYSFYLALWFGTVDKDLISGFSYAVGDLGGRFLSVLLVFPAGLWAGRHARVNPLLHGALVGTGAALLGLGIDLLSGDRIAPLEITSALGNLALGLLGGVVARDWIRNEERVLRASRGIEQARSLEDVVAALGSAFADRGVDHVALRGPSDVCLAEWCARDGDGSSPKDPTRSRPPTVSQSLESLRSREGEDRVLEVTCSEGRLSGADTRRIRSLAPQLRLVLENLRLLDRARAAGVLEERRRLAHEIHDTLAQGFASIVLHLEATAPALSADESGAREHLEQAREAARENLTRAREIVWALRPDTEERPPLGDAIRGIAERCAGGLKTRVEVTGEARRLRPEVEAALTRAAQEAITNCCKHAKASRLVVTLSYMEDLLALDVRDDGVGFDPEAAQQRRKMDGYGLDSLREGLSKIGGRLTVESARDEGTAVMVEVPALPFDPLGEEKP